MGERTGYTPGTFCWTDLTSTDPGAAKDFYSGLFGWEAADIPVGEGVFYSMMRLRGKDVAAIAPQPQQQRDAGAPPVWNSYVSVQDADAILDRATSLGAAAHPPDAPPRWLVYFGAEDIDASLGRVQELGGAKLAGPIDIGIAKLGVVQDPQGATFALYAGPFEP